MFNYPLLYKTNEFDSLLEEFLKPFIRSEESSSGFPRYNILKYKNSDDFRIEMAVAGINKDDLVMSVEKNVLTISHKKKVDESSDLNYIHKGIAERNFVQRFFLGEFVQVKSADLQNGILVIELCVVIPEEKRPKIIPIGGSTKVDQQLLNE